MTGGGSRNWKGEIGRCSAGGIATQVGAGSEVLAALPGRRIAQQRVAGITRRKFWASRPTMRWAIITKLRRLGEPAHNHDLIGAQRRSHNHHRQNSSPARTRHASAHCHSRGATAPSRISAHWHYTHNRRVRAVSGWSRGQLWCRLPACSSEAGRKPAPQPESCSKFTA